jgi:RNA recognition motif-containing protein
MTLTVIIQVTVVSLHFQEVNSGKPWTKWFLDSENEPRIARPLVPLPSQPPYTAHVGNLSFDLTETEIENYFEGCKVISVRIMKDRIDNRPKGFGYVEFADLDSLKKALTLADGQLAGRNVRVSVAEPRITPWWQNADVNSKVYFWRTQSR